MQEYSPSISEGLLPCAPSAGVVLSRVSADNRSTNEFIRSLLSRACAECNVARFAIPHTPGAGALASQSKTKPLTTMSRDERLFGTNEMTSRYEVMLAVQKCLSSGRKHILLTPSAKIHFL
jgi:hypothetical protein